MILYFYFIFLFLSGADASLHRFANWYSKYKHAWNYITHHECASQYDAYLTGTANSTVGPDPAIWSYDSIVTPLIDCLLEEAPEYVKSNMASAQVLLGFMPTILAAIGPSMKETAMLFTLGRKPLLSLLVAIGSPGVLADRGPSYRQQIEDTLDPDNWVSLPPLTTLGRISVALVEYVVVLGSVANIVLISYELAFKTSFTFAQDAQWISALWVIIGVIVHLLGALCLRTAITVRRSNNQSGWRSFADVFLRSFKPYQQLSEEEASIHIAVKPLSFSTMLLSWTTTMVAAVNLVFGTFSYSGLLFINVRDALNVILRYMASVVVCRVVVMYELSVLRQDIHLAGRRTRDQGVEMK